MLGLITSVTCSHVVTWLGIFCWKVHSWSILSWKWCMTAFIFLTSSVKKTLTLTCSGLDRPIKGRPILSLDYSSSGKVTTCLCAISDWCLWGTEVFQPSSTSPFLPWALLAVREPWLLPLSLCGSAANRGNRDSSWTKSKARWFLVKCWELIHLNV